MYSTHTPESRYYRGPENGSRAAHCERNISEAIDASDEYAWVYGERASWVHWPKPPDPRAKLAAKTWDELLPGLFGVLRAKSDPCGYARERVARLTDAEKAANRLGGMLEGTAARFKEPGFHAMPDLPRPFHGWQAKEQPGRFGVFTSAGEAPAFCAEGVGRGGILFTDETLKEGDYCLIALKAKGMISDVIVRLRRKSGVDDLVEPAWTIPGGADAGDGWRQYAYVVRVPECCIGLMASAGVKQKPGERTLLKDFYMAPVLDMRENEETKE
jgi:hypothetical protein